jgi:glycogen debranching enzyme
MKTQVMSPEGAIHHRWTTPDRWPHKNMWLWDSAFHAIGWRHFDPPLAAEMLTAVTDAQQPDGRIPHVSHPLATNVSAYTQPPVLSLAALLVHEKFNNRDWLASIYPNLCRYLQWDLANRDTDGHGLVEWAIETTAQCRSGESGADNSSRFDSALQLDAPDFNAMLASDLEALANIASLLGRDADSAR